MRTEYIFNLCPTNPKTNIGLHFQVCHGMGLTNFWFQVITRPPEAFWLPPQPNYLNWTLTELASNKESGIAEIGGIIHNSNSNRVRAFAGAVATSNLFEAETPCIGKRDWSLYPVGVTSLHWRWLSPLGGHMKNKRQPSLRLPDHLDEFDLWLGSFPMGECRIQ